MKSRFCPRNQSTRTTCLTPTTKSSTSSAKKTSWDSDISVTSVSFSIISIVLKTSEAWVILLIKVTFMPILIFGITNGIDLGVVGSSKAST